MAIALETKETANDGSGCFRILPTALFFAMLTGVMVGGIYFMKDAGKTAAADELRTIFEGLLNSCECRRIFLYALAEGAALCAVIFIGAFFRFGFILPFLVLLRSGFVWGVSAAALVYGFKMSGLLLLCPFAAESMAEMSAMILFSAYTVQCSLMREVKSKKKLFFLLSLAVSIFCAAALAKGFLTTRFIISVYPKIA